MIKTPIPVPNPAGTAIKYHHFTFSSFRTRSTAFSFLQVKRRIAALLSVNERSVYRGDLEIVIQCMADCCLFRIG